ncbi:hypothetical protein H2201_002483 [Coniosporium apollinis]|uniref:Uncharacterized protein n=1 Tax=Coniosporium apollinis TaxID=61459 RepID=A0ABQ9P4H4_9PEZI|nr:hypothetical protein H2201_002483 [Coniosporium apollinis]
MGYGSVAASSLSILGLLGLVKSTVKLALGLEKCSTAGFNVDSLRGRYGYLPDESINTDLFDCDAVDVVTTKEDLYISKQKQFLQRERTPIVSVGKDWPGGLAGVTAVNLGNTKHEKSFAQSPFVVALVALLCSGATSWLLLCVTTEWNWLLIIAVPGLHASLLFMLALPLAYERQTGRPGSNISTEKYQALFTGPQGAYSRLHFLQARVNGGDVIHFRGQTHLYDPSFMWLPALPVSAFCATAYVCQYAVLKSASSQRALIWIGCQAALAVLRLGFWTINPRFDDPKTEETEYSLMRNDASRRLTFAEFVCASSSEHNVVPRWVWDYLSTRRLSTILTDALSREWESSTTSSKTKLEYFPLLSLDLSRILKNRFAIQEDETLRLILNGLPLRLGLCRDKARHVKPFLLVEARYKLVPSEYSNALTTRWGWLAVTADSDMHGYRPCRGYAFKACGALLHLRGPHSCHSSCSHDAAPGPGLVGCGVGCSWPNATNSHLDVGQLPELEAKMKKITMLQRYLDNALRRGSNPKGPDVYLTATPGTTTRIGIYCDPAHRHGGTLSDEGFDFEHGVAAIASYLEQREPRSIKEMLDKLWHVCAVPFRAVSECFQFRPPDRAVRHNSMSSDLMLLKPRSFSPI